MIGGNLTAMPANYVAKQREVNSRHLDGSAENASDTDRLWDTFEQLGLAELRPASVLSLGCRTGYELRALRRVLPDARLVGVDVVPEFIAAAREAARIEGMENIEFYPGDFCDGRGAADREFDVVLCIGSLEHAWNVRAAAAEMQRVCNRLLYVTADLERGLSRSDYAASARPSEWIGLFERDGWLLQKAWTEPGVLIKRGLHMVWVRT